MITKLKPGQRIQWKAPYDGSTQQGTIEDFITKKDYPHLRCDSYLVTMDFNGMTIAVDAEACHDPKKIQLVE